MTEQHGDPTFDNRSPQARSTSMRRASIGILTYRRPGELKRCLDAVVAAVAQPMPRPWTITEVLVIDNDPDGSAQPVVTATTDAASRTESIRYVHEPAPGVANARNRALAEATGDVLVFIDDDEIPEQGWPEGLLTVLAETGAAMVGGPVLTEFTSPPPRWIVDGDFFHRDMPKHGSRQDWLRSGNLAIDLQQVRAAHLRFDPRFREGEDSAFTRQAVAAGLDLRWSSNGAITEFVGAERYAIGWRLEREYLSNRAWTRTSLDLADGPSDRVSARVRTLAVAGLRLAQGLAGALTGFATRRRAQRIKGLATAAGALGKLAEMAAYRRP